MPRLFTCAILLLVLSGCFSNPGPTLGNSPLDDPIVPRVNNATLHHFEHEFSLTAGWNVSQASGPVYGLALNTKNCAALGLDKPDTSFHLVSGNATLTWDNPVAEISLWLHGDGGKVSQETPPSSSPVHLALNDINVTYGYRALLIVRMPPGPIAIQQATLFVEFDYIGEDELWPSETACWY
jgi:hypothetical protein